ncbi:hypothetical protein CAAN1_02S05666 [[Candida] anglica]|uniref:Rho1 guanine nucleotide exchange factor TUS1 n=1 Tax=[Candida] anglica TaxID=148631 RepID=A0ABP0ECF1_9ASCO
MSEGFGYSPDSSQSSQQQVKRSLRRKPPPPLPDKVPIEPTWPMHSEVPTSRLAPQIPPRPSTKVDTSLTSTSRPLNGPRDWHSVPDILADVSFVDDSFNGSFISMESPKPMGPKTLPEYEYSDTTIGSGQVLDNRRPPHQDILPYPIDDLGSVLPDELTNGGYYEDEIYQPQFQQQNLSPNNTSQIIHQSMHTPTRKIPPLIQTSSLSIPAGSTSAPILPPRTQYQSWPGATIEDNSSIFNPSPSPVVAARYQQGTSPTSPNRLRQTSPNRTRIMGTSPTSPRRKGDGFGSNSSSRSPSPRKRYYDKSPSPKYNGFNDGSYYEDQDDSYEYDDASFEYPQGQGLWNETSRNWDFDDEYKFYDDEVETDAQTSPSSTFFDYSALPEIPNSMTTIESASSSPKRMTLTSAMSFVKKPGNLNSPSLTSLNRKRLESDLPPIPLDLPQLPFSSSSLVSQHFSACERVWSMSNIFQWCLKLKTWLHDSFISKREFKKALIKLLVFHRSDIPLDIIGQNVDHIIEALVQAGGIQYMNDEVHNSNTNKKERGIQLVENAYVNGVLPELLGCYCNDRDHRSTSSSDVKLRCYSSQCYMNKIIEHQIMLKNTNIHDIILGEDWSSHWKLTAEDLRRYDKSVSKRQSLIYDLLKYEQTFIQRGECFVKIVGPDFIRASTILLGANSITSINSFEDDILKPGAELVKIHQETLMEPLLRILLSDGKFIQKIVEIADLYYQWSEVVKISLLKYISTVPMIEDLFKNPKIKKWVDNVRNTPRVKELKVNGPLLFMSTFNSRYQQLPLQLGDIRSSYDPEDQEYISLTRAIEALKKLGSKVNEMKHHSDNIFELKRISKQLLWKNNVNTADVNLGSENRRFFYRGDVTRKGDLKINSINNHLILLDNFLFITERVKNSKNQLSYRVVENPIPVEMLLVEIKETPNSQLGNTSSTTLDPLGSAGNAKGSDDDEESTFSFKVRYAGRGKHNAYVFTTKSDRERRTWIGAFIKARSNLCERLSKTEAYSVQPIGSSCFAYESNNRVLKLQVCAPNDPIEPAATESHNKMQKMGCNDIYAFGNAKYHLVFGKIQSLELFEYKGTKFYLAGLDTGIYCSDLKNGWKKILHGPDISKIAVDPSINIAVVLGNKSLRYYLLDSLIGVYLDKREKITGVSLSNEPISFFALGRHREITMLFYAKKKSNSATTNFKVLIPETDNDGVFSAFKVAKKFYVQADCYGISVFNSSFAVFTNKGFEILELDKLLPRSIPEVPVVDASSKKIDGYGRKSTSSNSNGLTHHPGIDIIRKYIQTGTVRPMGMFKLSNNTEFLLVYNDCAVFTNKHGKLSRYSMLRFDFRAKKIAFLNNNLLVACDEILEIWSISDFVNGSNKLIQVITGKDLSIVSDGDEVCVALANPKVPGLQLLLQLVPKSSGIY